MEQHRKITRGTIKTEMTQRVGTRVLSYIIYVKVDPRYLKWEQVRPIELALKRGIKDSLRKDPDVDEQMLVVVDTGWDNQLSSRYQPKARPIRIEVYFKMVGNGGLDWKKVRPIGEEILKGMEAAILEALLYNHQIVIPYATDKRTDKPTHKAV